MIKKILIPLIIFGFIGGGIGLYMFNKPVEGMKSMNTDFNLAAQDLLASFENDEATANTKYLDKVIEVTGKVLKKETENGNVTVYLETDNELSNIILQLEEEDSTINKNDIVTIKGICTGYLMDVVLVRAIKI